MSKAPTENLPAIAAPRLPYHPGIEERYGIDKSSWKALVEAVFPTATTTDSVILALSYCRARKLDVFKKVVHIVPIWDSKKKCMVDTVWPGIAEVRTTATRTGQYAGKDQTQFGPEISKTWESEKGKVTVSFPEWAQVAVCKIVGGHPVRFYGPQVRWLETYSTLSGNSDVPNRMWQERPYGQLDKCAEAAALRAAFPEECGDAAIAEEAGIYKHVPPADVPKIESKTDRLNKLLSETTVDLGEAEVGAAPANGSEPSEDPQGHHCFNADCGSHIPAGTEKKTAEHEGVTVYFCSITCHSEWKKASEQ